jgi:hypothetical protein
MLRLVADEILNGKAWRRLESAHQPVDIRLASTQLAEDLQR